MVDHQERISAGREASVAKAVVEPLLQRQCDSILGLLVADYRSGGATFQSLLGRIAEISALMGILDALESTVRQGVVSMEKEYAQDEKGR